MRRMAPPQSGHTHGASCTTSVRGKWSGSGCRYGLAVSRLGGHRHRRRGGFGFTLFRAESGVGQPDASISPTNGRRPCAAAARSASATAPARRRQQRAWPSGRRYRQAARRHRATRPLIPEPPCRYTRKPQETALFYRAKVGCEDRIGCRQSTPSSSIDNCAGVSTATPSAVAGAVNRPRSRRLAWSTSP
ncbi:unnamed protein product [Acanthosepion pharaonis]|uniref:Uncharacterized protein n=1 Tax=Acanthosepion pharaonis TaxID=158019 RepID=A0A812DKT8_ACAPH|nr:unnamed protein product [Sepia pharaonis]